MDMNTPAVDARTAVRLARLIDPTGTLKDLPDACAEHPGDALAAVLGDGTPHDFDRLTAIRRILGFQPGHAFLAYASDRLDMDPLDLETEPDAHATLARLFDGYAATLHTGAEIIETSRRIDERLYPLCRYDGFRQYEGITQIGENGYVTDAEYENAFRDEPEWVRLAYEEHANGAEPEYIARTLTEEGMDGLRRIDDEQAYAGQSDVIFHTEALEDGTA